jgi:oligopeptide/dipeptide ABC transporter ATP-binding protein
MAPVSDLILERAPLTLQLAGTALVLALLFSLPVGIAGGLHPGRWPDTLAFFIGSLFVSLPNFWLGIVLALVVTVQLGWLPSIGYRNYAYTLLPAAMLAVELASNRTLFFDPGHPYSRALLSAVPTIEVRPYRTEDCLLEGEPPSPIDIPAGCSFASRCPHAFDRCRAEAPALLARRRVAAEPHGRNAEPRGRDLAACFLADPA